MWTLRNAKQANFFPFLFSLQRITWNSMDRDRELCIVKGKSEVSKFIKMPTSLAPPSVIQGITEKPIILWLMRILVPGEKKTVNYATFESISYILKKEHFSTDQ